MRDLHRLFLPLVISIVTAVASRAAVSRQRPNGSLSLRAFISRDMSNTAHGFQPSRAHAASVTVRQPHRSLSLRSDTLGGLTMDRNMEQFIHRENLAHYRRLLAEPNVASDPVRHKLLIRLLADREAKDATPHGQ
jgi:hypothetical protein